MARPAIVFSALMMLAALPASAQEFGGIKLGGPAATLAQIEQLRPGCPLSQTSVTVGVNQARGAGSQAQQHLATQGAGGCRPLVSTQVVAGVNLGLGPASRADQSISASGPRGLLATTAVTRGYNYAVGPWASAQQRLLNQVGR
jgi:hypothetical protein